MYFIMFSASTEFSKILFKLLDFWSSMKMVIKELCWKKGIAIELIFFISVLWAVTGIPVLKKYKICQELWQW